MVTELGKELRKIRIDRDERLLDMAKRLNKSSAFVSAVEVGKKSPPARFEEDIIQSYQLAQSLADRLRIVADRARSAFTIEPESILGRDTAGLLARQMNSLSDEQLNEIQQILKKPK